MPSLVTLAGTAGTAVPARVTKGGPIDQGGSGKGNPTPLTHPTGRVHREAGVGGEGHRDRTTEEKRIEERDERREKRGERIETREERSSILVRVKAKG